MTERRLDRSLAACAAGALAVAGASAAPWSRFGSVRRSGYALATVARQAGLAGGAMRNAVVVGWLMLPLAATLCLAAAAWRRPVATPALCAGCAALGSMSAGAVLTSPIDHEIGVWIGIAAAAWAYAAAGWAFKRSRSRPISHLPRRAP